MKKGAAGGLAILAGVAAAGGTMHMMDKRLQEANAMSKKHLALFQMMNQWVMVKQDGKNLASYLEEKGYQEIAVYGMSYAGETFVRELEGSNIKIKYGIDKKADRIYAEFDIYTPENALDEVDAVVVTAVTFFDEVESMLKEKLDCPIISLEDILYEI